MTKDGRVNDLIVDIVPVKSIKMTNIDLSNRIDTLQHQINWLWSAIDEIWESMPQEPEPEERDDRA